MIRWAIRRLERRGAGFAPGATVAEVDAEGGSGSLRVMDPAFQETLEDLFLYDQTEIAGREEIEGGRVAQTTVQVLHPWQPETLEHVRGKLGRYGLVAEERPD